MLLLIFRQYLYLNFLLQKLLCQNCIHLFVNYHIVVYIENILMFLLQKYLPVCLYFHYWFFLPLFEQLLFLYLQMYFHILFLNQNLHLHHKKLFHLLCLILHFHLYLMFLYQSFVLLQIIYFLLLLFFVYLLLNL